MPGAWAAFVGSAASFGPAVPLCFAAVAAGGSAGAAAFSGEYSAGHGGGFPVPFAAAAPGRLFPQPVSWTAGARKTGPGTGMPAQPGPGFDGAGNGGLFHHFFSGIPPPGNFGFS